MNQVSSPPAASLDEVIRTVLDGERGELPGYVRRTKDQLGKPPWDQAFFDGCRRSLHALLGGHDDTGVLQVCSPGRDEDRASVAAAMALWLCRTYGDRVALLDLDFTGGELAGLFGADAAPGLAEWLEQGKRLRFLIGGSNRLLHLVPAGEPARDPAWLYRDVAQRQVVETFHRHFPWVVVNMPPLVDEPSAALLAPLAEWHMLVGRYRRTLVRDLEEVAGKLQHGRATGFVITGYRSRVPAWIRRLI